MLKKSHNKSEIVELKYCGTLLKTQNEICNAFNDHFSRIGERLQSTIDNNNTPIQNACSDIKRVSKRMKFRLVGEGEICKIIAKMPAKSSSSLDGISNTLLKNLAPVIKGPLCMIINASLR